MRRPCLVPNCDDGLTVAHGYCSKHYRRFKKYGDPLAGRVFAAPGGRCVAQPCTAAAVARQMCARHYARWRAHGDPSVVKIARTYQRPKNAGDYKYQRDGSRNRLAHRLVMEGILGRPLELHETVHHKNGDRADNKPENLELWSKWQPSGQRVEDKLRWAHELIAMYEPEPEWFGSCVA